MAVIIAWRCSRGRPRNSSEGSVDDSFPFFLWRNLRERKGTKGAKEDAKVEELFLEICAVSRSIMEGASSHSCKFEDTGWKTVPH